MLAPQSVVKLYAGSLLARLASEAGAEPLLTSVIASGPAVWPTWTSVNASAAGLTSSAPRRPVPLKAMLVVSAVASVSNDRVALAWPAAVGSNVTEIAQLAPIGMLAPQSVVKL